MSSAYQALRVLCLLLCSATLGCSGCDADETAGPGGGEICDDQIDNDLDGLTDCLDPDCTADPACGSASAEVCDNGVDDDRDGRLDCWDVDECCSQAMCADTPACNLEPGTHIGTVELDAPQATSFALRLTFPLPPGIYTPADVAGGQSPFGVVGHAGTTAPAQAVPITRYADGLSYDVVEIIAQVDRDPAAAAGERIQFEVLYEPNAQVAWPTSPVTVAGALAAGPITLPAHLADLVNQPLIVRATDVFGNAYEADLTVQQSGDPKVLRYGLEAVQVRTYNVLTPLTGQPAGPPDGTLPHLMGVHAYLTAWAAEPVIQLELRVSNGSAGLNGSSELDDAMAKLYFRELELVVPAALVVEAAFRAPLQANSYTDVTGTVVPLISALPSGAMHVMGPRAHTSRRLAICQAQDTPRARLLLEHRTLGFAVDGDSSTADFGELFSWHNPLTGRYFPQRLFTPRFDHVVSYPASGGQLEGHAAMRDHLRGQFTSLQTHYLQGTSTNDDYPLVRGNLGWAHPYGVAYGGMTGGTEINLTDGVLTVASGSNDGYRLLELQHRLRNDRQSTFLYTPAGDPLSYEDVTFDHAEGPYVPVRYFNDFDPTENCPGHPGGTCDPFGYGQAPSFHVDHVSAQSLSPGYEAPLLNYDDEDQQHLIRNARLHMALTWLGNDGLAKDDLLMSGELTHFSLATLPLGFAGTEARFNASGCLVCASPATPGIGIAWGRGQWHPTHAMAGAYSIATDDWRQRKKPWFDVAVDDVWSQAIIDCTGIIGFAVNKNTDNEYRAAHLNEEGMGDNALRAVMKSVYEGADAARAQTLQGVMEAHAGRLLVDELVWSTTWNAPRTLVPVADKDTPAQVYCDWPSVPTDAQTYSDNYGPARFETLYTAAYAVMDSGDSGSFGPVAFDVLSHWFPEGTTLLEQLETEQNPSRQSVENSRTAILACAQRGICTYP